MTKTLDQDLSLKLRFRRLLFCQGYWTPIEVELSYYEEEGTALKRRSLTDLDVLGIRYSGLLLPHKIIGDCKSGKNVSDVSRMFWIRGVVDYFGANQGYYLRPKIDSHARGLAPRLGISAMDEDELTATEIALNVNTLALPLADIQVQEAINDLWGVDIAKGHKPNEDELKLKRAYSFLTYGYWYIEAFRSLLMLIQRFTTIARLLDPASPKHVLLAFTGAERMGLSLLDIAAHVRAQGGDAVKLARTYIYGGALGLRDKEKFFELLRRVAPQAPDLDPPFLPDILEVLGRLLRNPSGASDVLRHLMAAYLWCAHLGNKSLPSLPGGDGNTAALVLAKDIAIAFSRATGCSPKLFDSLQSL